MILIFLSVLLLPGSGHALSKAELQELNEVWLKKQAERERKINTKDLTSRLPRPKDKAVKKEENPSPENVPENRAQDSEQREEKRNTGIEKYITEKNDDSKLPQSKKKVTRGGEAEAAPLPRPVSPGIFNQGKDGIYIPPPRIGGYGAVTDADSPDQTRVFGIRIGTWIAGELRRPASSAEPGLIEIYTSKAVRGDKKVLPPGSTLFAESTYNPGTKKQDFLVEKGITPQGREFLMRGLVFDLNKTAGLIGTVTTDSGMIVERSTSKGALAAGGAVAEQLAGDNLVGAAGKAAAESLLEDSSEAVERSKTLKQTIRTVPQKLLIRVEETF